VIALTFHTPPRQLHTPGPVSAAFDRLTAVMAARGFTLGDPGDALAGELTVDRLCAAEWPCRTCRRRGRRHVTYLAVDGTGRWRSVAFCDTCGTGEDL
jgi:hypothetical protein